MKERAAASTMAPDTALARRRRRPTGQREDGSTMTAVELEEQEPFWRRHLIAIGFVLLLVVIVVLKVLDQGEVAQWLADAP